ncbi:MAG: transposase [Peptococcaceae bacterium]|nr:transposase [Peptococcaceae bacterium]
MGSRKRGLNYCNQLFSIEKKLVYMTATERHTLCIEQSRPVLEAFSALLRYQTPQVLPKSARSNLLQLDERVGCSPILPGALRLGTKGSGTLFLAKFPIAQNNEIATGRCEVALSPPPFFMRLCIWFSVSLGGIAAGILKEI